LKDINGRLTTVSSAHKFIEQELKFFTRFKKYQDFTLSIQEGEKCPQLLQTRKILKILKHQEILLGDNAQTAI
jgi:hypothetical protein